MPIRLTKDAIASFLPTSSGCRFSYAVPVTVGGKKRTAVTFGRHVGTDEGVTSDIGNRYEAFIVTVTGTVSAPLVKTIDEHARKSETAHGWTITRPLGAPQPIAGTAASPIDVGRFASALDYVLRLAGDGDSWRSRVQDGDELASFRRDRPLLFARGWAALNAEDSISREIAFHAARVPGLLDAEGAFDPTGDDSTESLQLSMDGRTLGMFATAHVARILRSALDGASRAYCQRYTVPDLRSEAAGPRVIELARIVIEHADGTSVSLTSPLLLRNALQFLRASEVGRDVYTERTTHLFCGPAIPEDRFTGPLMSQHWKVVFALRAGRPLLIGADGILASQDRRMAMGAVVGGFRGSSRLGLLAPATTYLEVPRYVARDAIEGVHGARLLFQCVDGGVRGWVFVVSRDRFAMVSTTRRLHDNVEGVPYDNK